MIIILSKLQKEHLNLLYKHSTQVLVDFCKLTIDYLSNGMNEKKCAKAADKLNVPVENVTNLIYALAYLLVEGCKHSLSEPNFKSSLAIAGFSQDQQQVLVKLFNNKKAEISGALNLLLQRDPSYQDLIWRFEVQVASKSTEEEIKPMITMNFVLTTSKNFGQKEEDLKHKRFEEKKHISSINIISTIQDAKTASQCQHNISHVLLQCDLPNLIHLTNKLEEALKESKSQHIRKVQRAL